MELWWQDISIKYSNQFTAMKLLKYKYINNLKETYVSAGRMWKRYFYGSKYASNFEQV